MKACLQPRLFIHFVWFRMMFLPWITIFPIWRERWHDALCLRYQRFAASRCLVLARLGSFTKHEMDKATVMYCCERKKEGGKGRKKEGARKARGRRDWKMKKSNGVLLFQGEKYCYCLRNLLPFLGCNIMVVSGEKVCGNGGFKITLRTDSDLYVSLISLYLIQQTN